MSEDKFKNTISRREALSLALLGTGALLLGSSTRAARAGYDEPVGNGNAYETLAQNSTNGRRFGVYPYVLPPLPYSYSALSRSIDERTMRLHHDKHHKAYVDNLNKAIASQPDLQNRTPQKLIRNLNDVPSSIRDAVRNNAGGHVNHSMFWQIMSPRGGGVANGAIGRDIVQTFGSFARFQTAFNEAGTKRFGSGWVWLVRNNGRLQIVSTPNQDNPMMMGMFPIMGNDVWEHAYYLRYQNRRAEYLKSWWNVVDWNEVNRRYAMSM